MPIEIKEFHGFCDELTISEDLIFKGDRLLVPFEARQSIIERAHAAHLGINECINRVRDAVFWPKMNKEITDYVSRCVVCAKFHNDQYKETVASELYRLMSTVTIISVRVCSIYRS